jgi:hypothetical protein
MLWIYLRAMNPLRYTFFLILLLAGCSLNHDQLKGHWQATAFYQNGQSVQVPLDQIRLDLEADRHYSFRTIGHYSEAGYWRSSLQYVFLTDTVSQPQREQHVKVLYLSADTLKISMQHGASEEVLFMARTQ